MVLPTSSQATQLNPSDLQRGITSRIAHSLLDEMYRQFLHHQMLLDHMLYMGGTRNTDSFAVQGVAGIRNYRCISSNTETYSKPLEKTFSEMWQ